MTGIHRYQRGNVVVDDTFVRFGTKSYAVDKLTSVEVKKEVSPPDNIYIAFAIFGVLAIAASLGPLFDPGDWSTRIGGFLALLGVGAALLWASRRGYQRRRSVTEYQLVLNNAGLETVAYRTNDGPEMEALWTAIEDAIAAAGRR